MTTVQNMTSSRSGKPIANQFVIQDDIVGETTFQSYNTVICSYLDEARKLTLNGSMWDYSATTRKYFYKFIQEELPQEFREYTREDWLNAANLPNVEVIV